jgi:hypothetical protein
MKSIINSLLTNLLHMNTSHLRQKTVNAIAVARALVEREFSSLRQRQPRLLRQALNEAEAIAWQTGFPQLVFPTLALEKARAVATWENRQQKMWRPISEGRGMRAE